MKRKADRNFIKELILDYGLDDIECLNNEGGLENAIDYWVEHYYDDIDEEQI